MAEFQLAPTFLKQLVELNPILSAQERRTLDAALAELASKPEHPGRLASHYGPDGPDFLFRRDPFLIGFSVTSRPRRVIFMSVFRRSW